MILAVLELLVSRVFVHWKMTEVVIVFSAKNSFFFLSSLNRSCEDWLWHFLYKLSWSDNDDGNERPPAKKVPFSPMVLNGDVNARGDSTTLFHNWSFRVQTNNRKWRSQFFIEVVIFILGRHLVYHFLTGNTTLWAPISPDDLFRQGNPRLEHNFWGLASNIR